MQAKDIGTYLGIALGVISLGGMFIRLGTIQSDINNKIVVLESKIERFEEGNTSQNTEIVKDIEKIFEDLEGLDLTKETITVVKNLAGDVEDNTDWIKTWEPRVLVLDESQWAAIRSNTKEIEEIKSKIE